TGNAGTSEEAEISAKIGGDIYQLKGEIGDSVKQGQVLARIDDTRYSLAREKAGLGVTSAQISLEQQKTDLARFKALYEQHAISSKEYEAALNSYKMTEISLRSAQADLRSADVNLRDTAVVSPIAGLISARKVNAGESVNPGTPLFTIVDLSRVSITTGIAEADVNQLMPGMSVQVTFDSLGAQVFEGTITHISPVQDQAKLYPVKILVDNPQGLIKAGMFANGAIALSEGVEGLAVPKEAVLHDQGKDYVFIVSGEKAVRKEVTVGLGDDRLFQVKTGLNAGDAVIIVGHEKLKDGAFVKVAK
ncbi:efflux RND transporter periplasmic adaptor subunit, partial [bacterium]